MSHNNFKYFQKEYFIFLFLLFEHDEFVNHIFVKNLVKVFEFKRQTLLYKEIVDVA